ncbi:PREDICTED: uncharacterized protein LOC109207710 [Nicotiana attenuata]|uniref:uncharacterized protein LOC109207710 n=1 Tax=Nicotiana attenuata TaxID=49451 RepID=UPI0009048084|nr:PREDICTED: uncharacterized protein LOC109207710 [Nicotiana attenuata]
MNWFTEGDRNTRFFHNHVNGKRQKLQLKRIQNGDGDWLESQDLMANTAVYFFQKQFTREGDSTTFELLNNMPNIVTMSQNLELCKFPTIDEVKSAVFALSGDSTSGPDGFTGSFYPHCWDIVGEDIFRLLIEYYGGASLPKLEKILPSLISANQSGFVKGRSIFENILLTQEIVTDIRLRGKPANVVIKLDMAKAYDRVSWKYLLHVVRKMRFAEQFINMIWNLLANNCLFILSAEVLSRSLNKLFEDKKFRGFGMPKWSDRLNHLAYADDTIIVSSADPYSLSKVVEVLTLYEQTSGQLINKSKSSYFMHANVAG